MSSFSEEERDLFCCREKEVDDLTQLVMATEFRAGVLYGEPGVGRSSFLHAGFLPSLRAHGLIPLFCTDNWTPKESVAQSLRVVTGCSAHEGESTIEYIVRVILGSTQTFVLVLDDIDENMRQDARVMQAVAELYIRVASRALGRVRFVFSSARDKIHTFDALEKRTGTLFPPASRYELGRFSAVDALQVLQQSFAGLSADMDEEYCHYLVSLLASEDLVLPADIQIASLALQSLKIFSVSELKNVGGFRELQDRWVNYCISETGNARQAMRVLAQLAEEPGLAMDAEELAYEASLEPEFCRRTLNHLVPLGLVQIHLTENSNQTKERYSLQHEILGARILEIAAPVKLRARRASELLGTKVNHKKRLSLKEYFSLRRAGIVPSTPQEKDVFKRTRHLALVMIAILAVIPLLLVVSAYVSMSGEVYLDTAKGKEGVKTIVVRAGSSAWSFFHWLPKTPGFGTIIADSGLSEAMVSKESWVKAQTQEIQGKVEDYVELSNKSMNSQLLGLIQYAIAGEGNNLDEMQKMGSTPVESQPWLRALAFIARSTPTEISLVRRLLREKSIALRSEALQVAIAGEMRQEGSYQSILAESLVSTDLQTRQITFSGLRTMSGETKQATIQAALALKPDDSTRNELLAIGASRQIKKEGGLIRILSILQKEEKGGAQSSKEQAWAELLFRMQQQPLKTANILGEFIGSSSNSVTTNRFMGMLYEYAPPESKMALIAKIEERWASTDELARVRALPLLARFQPKQFKEVLSQLDSSETQTSAKMKVAMALAWGEIAYAKEMKPEIVQASLGPYLRSKNRKIRSAAARAYGYTGRSAQKILVKMVKKEFSDVAEGAAYGLLNTIKVGAPVNPVLSGIRYMWRKKGRLRRSAAKIIALMAAIKPASAYTYALKSTYAKDDSSLHAIGLRGLCNALRAGYKRVEGNLVKQSLNPDESIRRSALRCVLMSPSSPALSLQIALAMSKDESSEIRVMSAKAILENLSDDNTTAEVPEVVGVLSMDKERRVRLLAYQILPLLGKSVLESTKGKLSELFSKGDVAEKITLLSLASNIHVSLLAELGVLDSNAKVRIAALDTSFIMNEEVGLRLNSLLADSSYNVRVAALQRLAANPKILSPLELREALNLAMRDAEPSMMERALLTFSKLGEVKEVRSRIELMLTSRSEAERALGARACIGLSSRSASTVIAILEPLLVDESHDVRTSLLAPLATAYAETFSLEELEGNLRSMEARATHRLVFTAALFVKSHSEEKGVKSVLSVMMKEKSSFVRSAAFLVFSFIETSSDGLSFLRLLVP